MKNLPAVMAMLAALTLNAQNIALWKTDLPGHRKAEDASTLPDNVFISHIDVVPKEAPKSAPDNALAAKLNALKVTGLVWSDAPGQRRVLMGDIVMREGEAIPDYVFNDGKQYVLAGISRNNLRFEVQGDDENPVAFDVPFGLKDSLKNESEFSPQGDNGAK